MDTNAPMVVVSGCVAYDTVLSLDKRIVDVARSGGDSAEMGFLVTQRRSNLGGCAANICYGLRQLDVISAPLAVVGHDFRHREHFETLGIDLSRMAWDEKEPTANCTILTDVDGAQITAHYLGAAAKSARYGIGAGQDIRYGVVAPTDGPAMQRHVREFAAASIPVVFQPGQVVDVFSRDELQALIESTKILVANDREASVICRQLLVDIRGLARLVPVLVVTHGAKGSTVIEGRDGIEIPAFQPEQAVDPTGCGDAFVAGLVSATLVGLDPVSAGRVAALVAGINAAHWGTQSYTTTPVEVEELFSQTYQYRVHLADAMKERGLRSS